MNTRECRWRDYSPEYVSCAVVNLAQQEFFFHGSQPGSTGSERI
jgi:hypothetical protein